MGERGARNPEPSSLLVDTSLAGIDSSTTALACDNVCWGRRGTSDLRESSP
jgi:hypothetical protein